MTTTIEKQLAELDAKRKQLEAAKAQVTVNTKAFDKMLKDSDYDNAADLIVGLIKHFKINKYTDLKVSDKKAPTRMTIALRDEIKKALNGGASKRSLALKHNISYFCIQKVERNEYKSLK